MTRPKDGVAHSNLERENWPPEVVSYQKLKIVIINIYEQSLFYVNSLDAKNIYCGTIKAKEMIYVYIF